jgi:hypothetical protein
MEWLSVDFHGNNLPGFAEFQANVNSSFACPASVNDVEGHIYP